METWERKGGGGGGNANRSVRNRCQIEINQKWREGIFKVTGSRRGIKIHHLNFQHLTMSWTNHEVKPGADLHSPGALWKSMSWALPPSRPRPLPPAPCGRIRTCAEANSQLCFQTASLCSCMRKATDKCLLKRETVSVWGCLGKPVFTPKQLRNQTDF